jgi:3-oxoacyl-[acyl-carrier protein] reductase
MAKKALVTGGTRGIGFGIAQGLAREGYDLALCGMRPEADVSETLARLRELGVDVLYTPCDVGDADARQQMLKIIRERFGALHVLVNNAGVAPKERLDILEATEESFEWVLRTNLQGPYFLTQAVANWMVEQSAADAAFDGCIVNITSVSAGTASVARGEYCISKAGASMASQLWAVRLAEYGIGVYEIRPGITATDMTSGVQEKYDKLIAEGLTLQPRWGTPGDIGKAVTMLARGDLPYSTGQIIDVDGGMTVSRL